MIASIRHGRQPGHGTRVLLVLSLLAGLGCPYAATFRQGSPGQIGSWPPVRESRISIALDLEGIDPESGAYSETIRTYTDCELFTITSPGEAANVTAKISISKERKSDYRGAVIDIFFGLIPIHQSTNLYQSTTDFTTRDGERLSISRSEQSETWTHLLLIPLFPFINPGSVERRVLRDLARETILVAQEAGVFSE